MAGRPVKVGKISGVRRGELAAFDAAGTRIAVANTGERLFAFSDVCTHEHCSLSEEGTLDGTVVTCGCHGAQFRRAMAIIASRRTVDERALADEDVDLRTLVPPAGEAPAR